MDTVGAMLGPLLGFAMLAAIPGGYDAVFVTSFCFALMGLAVLVLMVPSRRAAGSGHRSNLTMRTAAKMLANRSYRSTLAAAGLLAACTVGDGFLYLVIQRRTDLAPEFFPLLFVGSAAVYLLLAVPVGRLADRIGRRRVFVGGHVALLGAYAAAGAPVSAVAAVVVCLSLLGAYYAATDGVLSALTVPMVPAELRSSGLAGVQTVVAAGRFIAAIAFGAIWTQSTADTALIIFGLALAAALLPAVLLLRVAREDSR
jgi:MFS family permease